MAKMEKDVVREAKAKAARFCSYRERAPQEVREKLAGLGLEGAQLEQALQELARDGFVDERRFASAYANGKLRIKRWGKLKIKRGLENYQLDQDCINMALESLPDDEYQQIMQQHIEQKLQRLNEPDPYVRNHKTAQNLISKGFEPDRVWSYLKGLHRL